MQAIVYTTYGPPEVLTLSEVAKPAPQDEEVLIHVQGAGLNAADWHTIKGEPFIVRMMTGGILKPKNTTPGFDIAGKVVVTVSQTRR